VPGDGCRVTLSPGAGTPLTSLTAGTTAVTLLIGPEGGLTDAEVGLATGAGFEPRSLGPRILRTETAALAALAVLQATAGDLR
jgi:16S rRNA (uracil1498-N3)-methyltransferase